MKNYYKENEIQIKGGKHLHYRNDGAIINRKDDVIVCGDCATSREDGLANNSIFYVNSDKTAIVCKNCGREIAIEETYETMESKIAEENTKRLLDLHLILAGRDWECGMKFYRLSANIDYEDWLKVKQHFRYYNHGWSRDQELEFDTFEPTGWLTRNPQAVEDILVDAGLIKPENTMQSIEKRAEVERQAGLEREEMERKEKAEKAKIEKQMEELNKQINEAFKSSEARELSDADANARFHNCTYAMTTTLHYTLHDNEIVESMNMGDFKYAIAVPYSKKLHDMISEFYRLKFGELRDLRDY